MKLFNLDSPIMVFLTKVANLMILNIITLICCIPIITIGPAMTALYYVTIKMARGDDPYIVKSYFKSFKENFKQSTIIWLIMLLIIFIITVDWTVAIKMMQGNAASIMKVLLFVITLFLLLTGLYIFPVLSRFENTVKNTIKNAFLISIMNLPKSILIVLIHILPVACVLISLHAIPVLMLLGIALVAYLSSKLFVGIFKRFEPEEEKEDVDPDEYQPLSFMVEEQREKEEELKAGQEQGTEDAAEAVEEVAEDAAEAVEEATEAAESEEE